MNKKKNDQPEIDYSNEAAYYLSQQILLNLLVGGKIDKKNRETFSPFFIKNNGLNR